VTFTDNEMRTQPDLWRRTAAAASTTAILPPAGARTLVIGCGTSAFVAQSMAWLRDEHGAGPTDWAYASELPVGRTYDHVVAVTRSGTTTEVGQALIEPGLAAATRTVVTAAPAELVDGTYERIVDMSYADEMSVVQTRFPTTLLTLWRAALGEDTSAAELDAELALADRPELDVTGFEHFVFLGRGWTIGLAHEAALKMRECAQAWSESHPALDYRHGPISAATERTLVVSLGRVDDDLLYDVRATGATVFDPPYDPLARLVACQRLAVDLADHLGLDVDRPRHLARSVILDPLEESR
jgi:glucosamine--fructose-6-phosphate aminotransferase (isomerizing)